MTNGEKFIHDNLTSTPYFVDKKVVLNMEFDAGWWNAEYKEPTTKNDLGVDCIDRVKAQTEIEMSACRYTIAKERGGMGQVEWSDQLIKVSDAVDIIRNLPPVIPQESRWIPVSERLPEAKYGESDSVLVCFENGTQDVLYFDGSNWCYPTGEIYISVNHKNGWHNKVVAWMSLPKPYEPQESEG